MDLTDQEWAEIQDEFNTCKICGKKGATNAHNTCSGCEHILYDILDGM